MDSELHLGLPHWLHHRGMKSWCPIFLAWSVAYTNSSTVLLSEING